MKILVTVKRVTDYEAKLKLRPDNLDIERDQINMIMNPFDAIAVEEALCIKEKHEGEVVILSIGTKEAESQIRSALAMGADRGILVESETDISKDVDSFFIAQIIKSIIDKEQPDLVLMGKLSIDDENSQTAQMVAELWGVGQATQANKITIEDKKALVIREADGGLETLSIDLPGLITADLRLNEPRYAPLPGIMKAKKKPLEFLTLEDLAIAYKPRVKLKKLILPPIRKSGVKVADVAELIKKLREEAKVI